MKNAALSGKPYAGNPHVRFDEGEVASAKPRRGSLLYKNVFLLATFLLLCGGCGAEYSADEAASNRFSAEIQTIADSLVKGESKYPHQSVVARMNAIIDGMSNQVCRTEAARSYAKMLVDIDFDALPFKRRGAVAPLYGQHICFAFRTMVKNGVDSSEAISLFF